MDEQATLVVGPCTGEESSVAPDLTLGHLGRYEVGERIGRGGAGSVYEGRDPDLDRPVAIKVLHVVGRGAQAERARLLREARALAQVSSEHVVRVFDVGVDAPSGAVYLVMERIDGSDLRKWLQQPRPWREVLRVFLAAGRGLAAAHAAGVVHRDFKPANALVATDGRVCVGDFGLARSAMHDEESRGEPEAVQLSTLDSLGGVTVDGMVMGTPMYMAPEQHRGEALTAAADQFAFCVALAVALGSGPPFAAKSFDELGRVKAAGPPAISLPSEVPKALAGVLVRGLSPDPTRRYPDMILLLERIAAAATPRRRAPWIAAAMVTIGIGAVAASRAEATTPCGDELAKARAAWGDSARDDVRARIADGPAYASGTAESVIDSLDEWFADWLAEHDAVCTAIAGDGDASRRECLQHELDAFVGVVSVLQTEGSEAEHAGRVVATLPDVGSCGDRRGLGAMPEDPHTREEVERLAARLDRSLALLSANRGVEALDEATAVSEGAAELGFRPLEASARRVRGLALSRLGSPREATVELEAAALLASELGIDQIAARAELDLAYVIATELSDGRGASEWLERAEAANRRAGGRGYAEADGSDAQGMVAVANGDLEAARRHFDHAIEVGEGSQNMSTYVSHAGIARSLLGDQQGAAELHRRARDIVAAQLGENHPRVAAEYGNEGIARWILGERDVAADLYARELEILEAAYPPDHPAVVIALLHAMDVARERKDFDLGLRLADRVVAARERDVGLELPRGLYARGMMLSAMGRHDEAVVSMRRAVDLASDRVGAEHPELVHPLLGFGHLLVDVGRHADAIPVLLRAKEIADTAAGDPRMRTDISFQLAKAHHAMGDAAVAREHAASASGSARAAGLTELAAEVDAWLASAK